MAVSDQRLEDYAQRLERGKYGHNGCLSALLNCESEDLVTEVQNLRKGLRQLKELEAANADRPVVYTKILDLLDGRFE